MCDAKEGEGKFKRMKALTLGGVESQKSLDVLKTAVQVFEQPICHDRRRIGFHHIPIGGFLSPVRPGF